MHSFRVLLAFLFAFLALTYASEIPALEARKDGNATRSKDDKGNGSIKKACKEMSKLTFLTSLAANQTKLDELVAKGKMNAAKVDALKAKATAAAPKLQALSSNTTLTAECATLDENKKMEKECKHMKKLQGFADLANNATAMNAFAAHKKLNATQVDHLMEGLQDKAAKLKALQANTTLTDFCTKGKAVASPGGMLILAYERNAGFIANARTGTTNPGSASASAAPQQAGVTHSGAGSLHALLHYSFVPVIASVFAGLL
jgi:hypothetical protein